MICVRREILKEKLDLSVYQRSHRSLVHGGFTATGSLLIWIHVDMFQHIWWFLADSKWSELLVPGAQNWGFLLRQLIKSWVWCKCHCLKSYCLPSFSHLGPCSLLKPHITKLHIRRIADSGWCGHNRPCWIEGWRFATGEFCWARGMSIKWLWFRNRWPQIELTEV